MGSPKNYSINEAGNEEKDGAVREASPTLEVIELPDIAQIKKKKEQEKEKKDRRFGTLINVSKDELREIERKNWIFVAILITAGIIGSTLAYTLTYRDETNQIAGQFLILQREWESELEESFRRVALASGDNFEVAWELEQPLHKQNCNVSYHEAIYGEGWCEYFNQGLQHDQFHTLAEGILGLQEGVQALEWIPRVSKAARPLFEELAMDFALDNGLDTSSISWFQGGAFVPTTDDKEYYYPLLFTEPFADNSDAYMFDLHSQLEVSKVISTVTDNPETHKPAATHPVVLFRDLGNAQIDNLAFFTLDPVTVDGKLKGFSVATFLYSFMIAEDIALSPKDNVYIHVFDEHSNVSVVNFDHEHGDLYTREDYGSWVHTEVSRDDLTWDTVVRTDEYERRLTGIMKSGQTAGNGNSYYHTELHIYDVKLVAVIHTTEKFWESSRTAEPAVFLSVILVVAGLIIFIVMILAISNVRQKRRDREEQSLKNLKNQKQFEMVVDRLRSTEENLREARSHLSTIKLTRPLFRDYAIPGLTDTGIEEGELENTPKLSEILTNSSTLEIFKDFCSEHGGGETVMLWLDIREFQRGTPDDDLEKRLNRILKYYIVKDCEYPVNIGVEVKQGLLKNKCDLKIFDDTNLEIRRLLDENYWPTFKKSVEYKLCARILES